MKRAEIAQIFEKEAEENFVNLLTTNNRRGRAKVLLAVSGGVDSIVMATIASKIFKSQRERGAISDIAIAHANFKLRGRESDEDETFVKRWARSNGIRIFTKSFNTKEEALSQGISIEMAARSARYDWFYELAGKEGFTHIAIAHNANDNAETLLLNLVRGTGYPGLKGILPMRENDISKPQFGSGGSSGKKKPSKKKVTIIRPLIFALRSEIESYAKTNKITFRTDRTNNETLFARNKIRNKILPLLEEINPSAVKTLNKDIARFRLCTEILDEYVLQREGDLKRPVAEIPGRDILGLRERFVVAAYRREEVAKEKHVDFLIDSIGGRYGFTPSCCSDIVRGIRDDQVKIFDSPTHTAVIERGYLKIYSIPSRQGSPQKPSDTQVHKNTRATKLCKSSTALCNNPSSEEVVVTKPGVYKFGPFEIKITVAKVCDAPHSKRSGYPSIGAGVDGEHRECNGFSFYSLMEASKISFPLIIRTIREGDKFVPFGMRGSKKVVDFLNGRKVDLLFKNIIPVIAPLSERASSKEILCLPGVEIDERLKVEGERVMVVKISLPRS